MYVPVCVSHSNYNVCALSHFLHVKHACMCVCVSVCFLRLVSSGPLLMCVPHVCVLYTQHYVVVGAGAGVLS